MSIAKFDRSTKRQWGQFFTPLRVARSIVETVELREGMRVLEPSFGAGSFLDALQEAASKRQVGLELHGCEIDAELCRARALRKPATTESGRAVARLHCADFFRWMPVETGATFWIGNTIFRAVGNISISS